MKPGRRRRRDHAVVLGGDGVGQLLRRVRDRLDASYDPAGKAAAFGIAR